MIKVIDRRSFTKVLMVELKSTRRIYAMEELAADEMTITLAGCRRLPIPLPRSAWR